MAKTMMLFFPMRFLPIGGCYAIRLVLDDMPYYAVVDTGSPFWTVPRAVRGRPWVPWKWYPPTKEQYGDTTDVMEWRWCRTVVPGKAILAGIPSERTMQNTGGIYAGLIAQDDHRPTFLEQILMDGRRCVGFSMQFGTDPSLMLYRNNFMVPEPSKLNPTISYHALPLFDLTPFGPDLHHYAVRIDGLILRYADGSVRDIDPSSCSRPLVAVIDTGLTGCVLDAPLADDLRISSSDIIGISVMLPTVNPQPSTSVPASSSTSSAPAKALKLDSMDKYFYASRIELPWWYQNNKKEAPQHPYILALGNTFWTNPRIRSFSVDLKRKLAYIGTTN